jgi:aspartate/methionine/tyrosine aminotransferase
MSNSSCDLMHGLREAAAEAPPSGIVEMVNHGIEKPGLIPLWAGEGDVPTPAFICDGAIAALKGGETFYTYQRGIPALRQALSDYHRRHYGEAFGFMPDRFYVTGSGMQAIQIALTAVAGPGRSAIIPTPAWPNFRAALELTGARGIPLPMDFVDGRWRLDIDRLADAIQKDTRAIFINTPGNPTGWTATKEELGAILQIARERMLWIIADEVYGRFSYDGPRAASFHDVAEPEDRVLYVNTLSKNWAMTGWRIGWLEAPPALGGVIENLIQYSTSGVSTFIQRGAVKAINDGDAFVEEQIARAAKGREIVTTALGSLNTVSFAMPEGAFYLFFKVDGIEDVRQLGFDAIDNAGVGLAPGTAFGPGGEAFMRLCFARSETSLTTAMDRLVGWLQSR